MLESYATYLTFWSPDGRSFAFFDDGKLWKTDISGTPPQVVCDAPYPVGGGTWSRDGVIVFSSGGLLYRVLAGGGEPQKISTLNAELQESEHAWPNFLPDGRHYVYLSTAAESTKSAIYIGELDSTATDRLFASESRAVYAAPGYLLFNRGSAVFAQEFDAEARQLKGEARRLVDANLRISVAQILVASQSRLANFDVSQTGVIAYRSGSIAAAGVAGSGPSMTMTWFDRFGSVTQVEAPGTYSGVDLAPDGERFAVHKHEGNGGDSWFYSGGRLQRLTFNVAQDNSMPVWSRDGKRIAFGSLREGKWGIYIKASDGTGTEQLVVESELPKMPMSWSAGDKELVYWVNDHQTRGDVWMVPLQGSDREPRVLLKTPDNEMFPVVSPDGKWMAYQSDANTTPQIYVEPFPDGAGNRSQISVDGGNWPRWRGDTQELYYVLAPNIMAADVRFSGSSVEPGVPRALFPLRGNPNVPHPTPYHRYAVTRDGQRFLVPQPAGAPTGSGGLSGTLATFVDQQLFSGGNVANPGAINVILNWPRRLDRK
jgi:Tol biopolymer transport system component